MRRGALLSLVLVAPVIAACGSAGKSATGATSSPPQVLNASHVVLGAADLGSGWIVVPAETKPVTLEEAMKGDPTSIRTLEQHAFVSAYEAGFVNARKAGVFAAAYAYKNRAAALAIANVWNQMTPQKMRGAKLVPVPAGAPGEGFALWKATMKQGRKVVPLYLASWVHGNVIAGILMFGRGVTPAAVVALAGKQDARVLGASVVS